MQALAPFPTIETERLTLREIQPEDAEALFAIHGDPEIMKWFGSNPLLGPSDAQELVKRFATGRGQANPATRWGIQLRGRGQLEGTCGVFGWNREWRKGMVGYELSRQAQGQGYMHEALTAVISWGFANMSLNRVEAQIHPENLASLRLARKLGFIEEGRLRQVGYWRDQYHDMLQFSLLRREWVPVGAAA